MARRFDPARRELGGEPVTVAESVAVAPCTRRVSVSATGAIAYRRVSQSEAIDVVRPVRQERSARSASRTAPASGTWRFPATAGERRSSARCRTTRTSGSSIRPERLDSRPTGGDGGPSGRQTALESFTCQQDRLERCLPESLERRRHRRMLFSSGDSLRLVARRPVPVLYFPGNPKTAADLWVLPMDGERKPVLFLGTSRQRTVGTILTRWAVGGVPVQRIGTVRDVRATVPRPGWTVAGLDVGRHPSTVAPRRQGAVLPCTGWQADGGFNRVEGCHARGGYARGALPDSHCRRRGCLVGYRQQYDVAPDGRFLINVETESTSPPVTLVLNWKPKP